MSHSNSCSKNYSSHPPGDSCHVPVTSPSAFCSTKVTCGNAPCYPNSQCPGVSGRGLGQRWLLQGQGHWVQQYTHGTFWRTSSLSALPPQLFGLRSNNREGTQPCPQQKIGLKIYWAWPRPSEQDPVSPSVSLSYQESSISPLSIRGQTEWKLQSQKTNQTDHMDHSLI